MTGNPLLFATAVEAVVRAGDIQMAHFGRAMRVDKKGMIDLVTEVDVEVETMFRALVAERYPGHAVLAEEMQTGLPQTAPSPRYCWIFDPIDGTVNYAHGLPIFCASLALAVEGRVELGVVYDPTRQELFSAERGVGAWLNGVPLAVSTADRLVDAMLCTGFPYTVHDTVDEIVGLFGQFVGRARAVRRLGSAAVDLCYLAAGRLDGFWEQRLQPWDMAAAALIVEEAGGQVSSFAGAPFDLWSGEILASNGRIHHQMLDTIRGFVTTRVG